MKSKAIIISLIFLFLSSANLLSDRNYSKLYKGLELNNVRLSNYQVLLIVPESSCQGLLSIIRENLDKIVHNEDLKIVYLMINQKINYDKIITTLDYYENYKYFNEVFGIRLYILNKGIIIKEIEIGPNNINEMINKLAKQNINKNDKRSIEKLGE